MKKKYNKYTNFLDRFPFIPIIIILILSLIFLFTFKNKFPLNFFSATQQQEVESESDYTVFITSPSNNEIFSFINKNESIPVEIKAKEVENLNYKLVVLVNETEEIKTFSTPPYEFNWNPNEAGEYEITANLLDENNNVISTSNKVTFLVEYEEETDESTVISMDVEEKKINALSNVQYRTQNGEPLFSYKCYIPPSIDGSMSEWEFFEKFSNFTPTIKKENYSSHTDVSGIFYSCWDDNNFYFAIQVIDDVFNQSFTGNQINKGDSITLIFDTELEEDIQIPFRNSDDFQIDFSPGTFSGIYAESFISWPTGGPAKDAVIASTRLTNGYIIEASIPWYNFVNYSPQDEDVLGFTVSIFDTDNLESTELVISSSTQFEINNVSTLGTIVFIDAGDIQQEEEITEPVEEE